MDKLAFTNTGRKLTAAKISEIEEQLATELPDDYRQFLSDFNGGTPSRKYFRATGPYADPSWVDFFHFADEHLAEPDEQAEPESLSFARHALGAFVPEDSIIIGSVVRDNRLLLRIAGKRRGEVDVKIFNETELGSGDWSKEKERGVYPVAKSFSQFLAKLQAPADPNVPATFALDSDNVRGQHLNQILKKLGCKKLPLKKPWPAWHWPKFHNASSVGGPAYLSLQKNKTYGYQPKFDERPEGHEMLLVGVTKSQREECIGELAAALGKDAVMLR